jgi:hypothetical protein
VLAVPPHLEHALHFNGDYVTAAGLYSNTRVYLLGYVNGDYRLMVKLFMELITKSLEVDTCAIV